MEFRYLCFSLKTWLRSDSHWNHLSKTTPTRLRETITLKNREIGPGNCLFVCFDSLCPIQQFFSHITMGFSWFNQYKAEDKVSCSRIQCSVSGEAWIPNPSGTLSLSDCAPRTRKLQITDQSITPWGRDTRTHTSYYLSYCPWYSQNI